MIEIISVISVLNPGVPRRQSNLQRGSVIAKNLRTDTILYLKLTIALRIIWKVENLIADSPVIFHLLFNFQASAVNLRQIL